MAIRSTWQKNMKKINERNFIKVPNFGNQNFELMGFKQKKCAIFNIGNFHIKCCNVMFQQLNAASLCVRQA
jgi:hypothetical protein